MHGLRKAPVLRALVPFAAGSLMGYPGTHPWKIPVLLIACTGIGVLLLVLHLRQKGRSGPGRMLFVPLVSCLLALCGMGTGRLERPEDPGLPVGTSILLMGRILDEPRLEGDRYYFRMELRAAVTRDTLYCVRSKVRTYMPVPWDSVTPAPDETWMMAGRLLPIRNNGNPGETDYAAIYRRRNCWYTCYPDPEGPSMRLEEGGRKGFPGPHAIRSRIAACWEGAPETVALLNAVCLGDRSHLTPDMQESFSMAGGMHILAVSGLHVGLIWWVLHHALSFLVRLSGREVWRVLPVTLVLWIYAWTTGFSVSVCRSVTMFSFMSLALLLGRRSHPLNTILVSMFFLLVIHPGWLMEVGFQLSYAAVISILVLHPPLLRMVKMRKGILRRVWEALSISIAAQAGTLPLVIHYFHQIPLYALLTNLLAIPLLSCIITLFVVALPMAVTGSGFGIAAKLMMLLGGWMNRVMEQIASLPGSVLGDLQLVPAGTVLLMVLIFLAAARLHGRKHLARLLLPSVLLIWLALSTRNQIDRARSASVVVAHFQGSSLVSFQGGERVDHYLWCREDRQLPWMDAYLSGTWNRRIYEVSVIRMTGKSAVLEGGTSACLQLSRGCWMLGNRETRGLVITAGGCGIPEELIRCADPDFILLSGEPRISYLLQKLLADFTGTLITDGSCRSWYVHSLSGRGLRVYQTGERGAWVTDVKKAGSIRTIRQ